MKFYQDLMAAGQDEKARMDFVLGAINDFKAAKSTRLALDAKLYYLGENPTINRYEKIIYDMQGRAHKDMWTANHKIASKFFGFAVDQEVAYLLGNGVSFSSEKTNAALGATFDEDIMDAARHALIGGQSFVFWNLDHLQVFSTEEFVPLYDEENGALKAGIRFWQVADNKPLRCTLYELDGYTDYIKPKTGDMQPMVGKMPYKIKVRHTVADGTEIYDFENYPGFPIVPLKNGENAKSELAGRQTTLDALDLACSNMVNNVDEGNLIYWVLTNCGGMDEVDDAQFIERLKTTRVAHADGGDGAKATPQSVEAPFEGTQTAIDMLTKRLYADFQAFDAAAVTAGNQTATAIKASYVPLDLKTDKFESYLTRCIKGILALVGLDDEPTYTRNQIVNKSEEVQTVLLGAEYYDDEYITKKLLTILGDADQFEDMMRRKATEELNRTITNQPPNEPQNQPGEGMNSNGET